MKDDLKKENGIKIEYLEYSGDPIQKICVDCNTNFFWVEDEDMIISPCDCYECKTESEKKFEGELC
jgi:hypothetical protein